MQALCLLKTSFISRYSVGTLLSSEGSGDLDTGEGLEKKGRWHGKLDPTQGWTPSANQYVGWDGSATGNPGPQEILGSQANAKK